MQQALGGMVLINQDPCPVELVFLGGCWARKTSGCAWSLDSLAVISDQSQGSNSPLWSVLPPSSQQVGSWPRGGRRHQKWSLHSQLLPGIMATGSVPEGLFLSNYSKLNFKQRRSMYLHCKSWPPKGTEQRSKHTVGYSFVRFKASTNQGIAKRNVNIFWRRGYG